jgi:hypothetical protein
VAILSQDIKMRNKNFTIKTMDREEIDIAIDWQQRRVGTQDSMMPTVITQQTQLVFSWAFLTRNPSQQSLQ